MRWDYKDISEKQFEVHPIPNTDGGYMRFSGTRNLNPLVADTDKCTLDADLIVLFAAVEILGPRNDKEAERKLKLANAHLVSLRGLYQSTGDGRYVLGGGVRTVSSRQTPRLGPPLVAVDRGT
jgi:hypothetical protein